MAGINIGKAPKDIAVLPFFAAGAVFFLLLAVLLFIAAPDLTGHYFSPRILALVHTAALGWGTMIIFGAAYQLLPVICERDLFSSPLAFISFLFLTAGSLLLIGTFWFFKTGGIMVTGGSLIFIAALLYSINVWKTARSCDRYAIAKCFILSSSLWLLLTIGIGLLLAVNLAFPFFDKSHLEILKLHAHAGLAGWFLQLITGVSIKLVPMFLLGKSQKDKLLRAALILQNAGLILFLTDGYFFGISIRTLLYATLLIAGIICWMLYIADVYRRRVKKKTDMAMKHVPVSFVFLLISLLLVPVVFYKGGTAAVVYGTCIFMGWITALILGKTFKTLPFIVWNSHYKNLNGKVKIPLPKDLYSFTLLKYQYWLYIISMPLLLIGLVFASLIIIRISLFIWTVMAIIYLQNVLKILFHQTRIYDGNINR